MSARHPAVKVCLSASTLVAAVLVALSVASCGGSFAEGPDLRVASSLNLVQCDDTKGKRVAQVAQQLQAAGIAATLAGCAWNGMLYPAVCGAGTGDLVVFDVPASKLAAARSLDFAPLADWPHIQQLQACRAGL